MPGHGPAVLGELALFFAVALAAALAVRALRLPVLVGYLLAGVLAGPHAFGLLHDTAQVKDLAELGVVLLLFSIGLEISPSRLWTLRREALIGGGLQVLLTASASALVSAASGLSWPVAIAVGFFVSLSSTAVVLRLLSERGDMDRPHGRFTLAVLLLQDLAVVPITLAIPLLAGEQEGGSALLLVLGKTVALIAIVLLLARRLIPALLDRVARQRSRELFLLSVAAVVLATAWITTRTGLSPALGAFLAGLVISETEHRHLALAEAAPFRELFLAVFFLSIGMMLDLPALVASPLLPLLLSAAVLAGKGVIVAGVARVLGRSTPDALRAGAHLAQVGEFSFVILLIGSASGLIGEALVQPLVATAALTLLATPFVIPALDHAAAALERKHPLPVEPITAGAAQGHVIIAGFGLGGQSLAKVLKALEVPYRIAEMNPETVRREKEKGEPILLGDASRPEVLEALDVHRARAAVVAINDPRVLRPLIQVIKREHPELLLLVRTRFAADLEELERLGADVAVPEELETSLQVVGALLHHLGFQGSVIHRHLEDLRAEGYRLSRSSIPWTSTPRELAGLDLRTLVLEAEDGALGRTLVELNLRRETGATVISLTREGTALLDPAHTPLAAGDGLVLSGSQDALDKAQTLLRSPADRGRSST